MITNKYKLRFISSILSTRTKFLVKLCNLFNAEIPYVGMNNVKKIFREHFRCYCWEKIRRFAFLHLNKNPSSWNIGFIWRGKDKFFLLFLSRMICIYNGRKRPIKQNKHRALTGSGDTFQVLLKSSTEVSFLDEKLRKNR